MENSHLSEHLKDPKNFKRFQQEILLLDVAALIYSTMREKNIKRTELAKKLGLSKGRISQYLGGEKNLRLRTMADIFTELGCRFTVATDTAPRCGHWNMLQTTKSVQMSAKKWVFEDCLRDNGSIGALAG